MSGVSNVKGMPKSSLKKILLGSNIKIQHGISDDINQEAIRVIKLLSNNWIPAKLNGKNIRAQFVLPLRFKIG